MPNTEDKNNMVEYEFKKFFEKHEKGVCVKDGVYDVSNIDFLHIDLLAVDTDALRFLKHKEVAVWIEAHDKFWMAHAYGTYSMFLFTEEPRKFEGTEHGNGFNYGSTNVIVNCPKAILILAEDD